MDSLIPTYKAMAKTETGNYAGLSILNHRKSIKRLIAQVGGARTMLDFGCGKGDAYRSPDKLHHYLVFPRAAVKLYDPAFGMYNKMPSGTYDLVVCSDVLEHIPEPEVDEFIARLFGYARRAVWASVCCRAASKNFPGTETNVHVTIQPYEWWAAKFAARTGRIRCELVETR